MLLCPALNWHLHVMPARWAGSVRKQSDSETSRDMAELASLLGLDGDTLSDEHNAVCYEVYDVAAGGASFP